MWYSTKQKPHGVSLCLSRPMITVFTTPHLANSDQICSSLVKNDTFPTYRVAEDRRRSRYSSMMPLNRRSLY